MRDIVIIFAQFLAATVYETSPTGQKLDAPRSRSLTLQRILTTNMDYLVKIHQHCLASRCYGVRDKLNRTSSTDFCRLQYLSVQTQKLDARHSRSLTLQRILTTNMDYLVKSHHHRSISGCYGVRDRSNRTSSTDFSRLQFLCPKTKNLMLITSDH
jgi:hypothetical protein